MTTPHPSDVMAAIVFLTCLFILFTTTRPKL